MRPLAFVAPVTALAALLASFPAGAAEWRAIDSGHLSGMAPREAAEAALKASSDELGLRSVRLAFKGDIPLGTQHTVRFTQHYAGLPVFGASAAVRVGEGGDVRLVVLDVARDLAVSPTPRLTEAEALSAVEGYVGSSVLVATRIALGVLPQIEGGAALVFRVDVPSTSGGHRYFVDAHRGLIVGDKPLAVDVLGRVYAIGSVNTPTPSDLPLLDLTPMATQLLSGWSGNFDVTNYASGGTQSQDLMVTQDVIPNVGADFLYDPPADPKDGTDAFAQVGLYYHLTRMRDFFATDLGLDMSDPSWKLVAIANLQDGGQPTDNAFFSPMGLGDPWNVPNLIAIGQGASMDFADDSDVFLHEFTHYVSGNAVGYNDGQIAVDEYGLSTGGGSIDEGISDYFACTVNGDPILGEATLVPLGAERDLTDTSKVCPDDVVGEVHEDGELIGSVSWTLHEKLGKELGDKLVWGAVSLLTKGSSLGDFGAGLVKTAEGMVSDGLLADADLQTIQGILAERGLDDCGHVLEVNEDSSRKTNMFGLDLLGQLFGASCSQLRAGGLALQSLFHFSHTPAPGDKGLRIKVDLTSLGGGSDYDFGIYVRVGQHVSLKTAPGGFLPVVNKYDLAVEHIGESTGEIVIDETSNPPFDPSQTYYFVIEHQNCPTTQAFVQASAVTDDPGPTGAGGGGGDATGAGGSAATTTGAGASSAGPTEIDSGCGCRAAGDTTEGSWAGLGAMLLAAGAAVRRRSRR